MEPIAARLARVNDRIQAACRAAGRDAASVRLIAVSKTKPIADVLAANDAGQAWFGENKVQDALAKAEALAGRGLRWAMLGHLQTNKARDVARFADEFQALDSLRVAVELDRRLRAEGRQLDVLIEVNSSGEDSKFGVPPGEVVALARGLASCDALRLRGLMTLALRSSDPAPVVACFEGMRAVQERLRQTDGLPGTVDELSMGMSDDFELASAHGATTVRIGRALFGEREPG